LGFPGAAVVSIPSAMKIADCSRFREVGQFRQRGSQNLFVSLVVAGTSKRATHRMIDKDGARRRDFGHDI
ncbi:MAG TPA: hypothetical protein VEG60_19520, partial [Candidatus Binatia bacterium]|nr:hypothetical protein [Candidatus Binatia bacterium]